MKAINDIIPPTPAKFESFIQEVGGTSGTTEIQQHCGKEPLWSVQRESEGKYRVHSINPLLPKVINVKFPLQPHQ